MYWSATADSDWEALAGSGRLFSPRGGLPVERRGYRLLLSGGVRLRSRPRSWGCHAGLAAPALPGGGGGGIAAGARGGRFVFGSCRGGCIIGFMALNSAASVWVGASAAGSVMCVPVSSCSGVSDKDTLVLLSFSFIRRNIMHFKPIDSCKSRT